MSRSSLDQVRPLALILAAGLLLAGCGDDAQPRSGATAKVTLKLTAPDDASSLRADRVAVRGTVSPADAAVQVAGEDAEVEGGEFQAEVALRPGGNVIDISASAPGRRPATDAVRVTRDMRIPVPKLVGLEVDRARDQLGALGLIAEEEPGGGWLDRVIPGTDHVCAVEPGEGTLVQPRSTVTLLTQRDC
jgi:hypothetical protein